jgi:hypothetical protein
MVFIVPLLAGPIALAITWLVVGVPASSCGGFCSLAAPAAYVALFLYAILACALSIGIAGAAASSRRVRASRYPALIVGVAGSFPLIALASASLWLIVQALATA